MTLEDIGLKPKPKVEPAKKLKSLFWSKVQPKSLAGTVWISMKEPTNIEFKELEGDFFDATKEKASAASPSVGEMRLKKKAPAEIILVDPKRNQNVSIALARFKSSNVELRQKIIAFDPTMINGETIGKLQMMIPEDEEIGLVRDFDGDKKMLGKVEKFFLEMARIPRLKMRLDCASVLLQFDTDFELLVQKKELFLDATKAVKSSKSLLEVLSMIMAIGNYLNGGNARGQAHGFKLDVLTKLTNMRANERKKGTLMNFLLGQIERTRRELLEFPSEMLKVEEASAISLNQLESDFKQLEVGMKKVKNELNRYVSMTVPPGTDRKDDAVQSFTNKMKPFVLRAEDSCTRFAESMQDMKMKI